MSDKISTKAGVFESGDKDVFGVDYKNGRLISCRNRKLTEYSVAEGTEVICDRAFMNMSELRSLVLPSTIRAIGESAFSGCKSLADINIPDGITEIRQATFRDTDALTALELPASVSEVEKFAFGRNLETLVVNSPDVKFDRYAFANVKDLKTLIVPAGSADCYRSQLFDIRVKATVEEMESEPASLMEEKKKKVIEVEVRGYDQGLQPIDEDGEECGDCFECLMVDDLTFTVDDKEYTPNDFSSVNKFLSNEKLEELDLKDLDVTAFFMDADAVKGMLYTFKAGTTIEIEVNEDEDFDPKKAALIITHYKFQNYMPSQVVRGFVYDGEIYECYPDYSRIVNEQLIWKKRDNVNEGKITYTKEEAPEELLVGLDRLPVLAFVSTSLATEYEGDADDVEIPDEFEDEGIVLIESEDDSYLEMTAERIGNVRDNVETIWEDVEDTELVELDYVDLYACANYAMFNAGDVTKKQILDTVSAVWEKTCAVSARTPAYSRLAFRVYQKEIGYASEEYEDFLLADGKVYTLHVGKLDDIFESLPADEKGTFDKIVSYTKTGEKTWLEEKVFENEISSKEDNNNINLSNQTVMEELKVPGKSVLVLTGNGKIIEGVGDLHSQFYAAITSDLKITLNGRDITDEVEIDDYDYFLMNKFFDEDPSNIEVGTPDEESELPASVFLLPEDVKGDEIKLIKVGNGFGDLSECPMADFIQYDGENLESVSLHNKGNILKPFKYKDEEYTYDCNFDFYNEHYSEDNQTTLYYDGGDSYDDDDDDF